MPNWSVKIVADTVTPKLAAFAGKIQHEVEMELDVVGADMEDLAKELAPYLTGFLRDSIQHRASGFTLDFWAEAYYSAYQEFGTRFIPPHPFMRPALDANQQKILDAIRVGCMNALGV
jgi:HK97 gp10 family phage protein